MTTLREAAQQALEALEGVGMKHYENTGEVLHRDIYEALKAALEADDGMYGAKALTVAYENGWNAAKAEPVQEPVAWFHTDFGSLELSRVQRVGWKPLYTAPTQRKPLTDEEIVEAVRDADLDWARGWTLDETHGNRFATLVRAIERAHGIGGAA